MHSKIRFSPWLGCFVLAGAVTACGSTSRKTPEDTGGAHDIPDVQLIENAEDGDAALIQDEEAGIVGYWYAYDDRQECEHADFAAMPPAVVPCGMESCSAAGDATKTDPPTHAYNPKGDQFAMHEYAASGQMGPGTEGSQKSNDYGLRLTGGGETFFGVGVGVGINNPGTPQPYDLDANGFKGLRFLAKSGTPGTTLKLRVKIKDIYSEPLGGKCIERKNVCTSGTCQCCDATETTCGTPADLPAQGCHDDPLAPADKTVVTDQWQLFEIPFSDFQRENWSTQYVDEGPPGTALVTSAAYQVQFQVQTDATPTTNPLPPFELWIDNIGFMEKLPETPTGMLSPDATTN